jgi:hypothetical protein
MARRSFPTLDRIAMNPDSRAAIDAAERRGYLSALRAQAEAVCVPFWWHGHDESNTYRILHNGTVSFVDTGIHKLAITADHVVAQYMEDRSKDPNVTCQFGLSTVEIGDRIIARDSRQDLATIDVSEVLVGGTGASFHAPREWPPSAVSVGDVVLCGGYPGSQRIERKVSANLPFQWFVGRATSASAHNVSLHLDFENMHTPVGDSAVLNRVIGGMSGGPIFRFVSSPIEYLEQVGVIYQLHEGLELVVARPTLLIRSDGSILPEHAV